jgi:TATA-binding protein-associated factor Taf7
VVYVYESGETIEVEFINAVGETLAVETLLAVNVKPIDQRHAVLHVNEQLLNKAA